MQQKPLEILITNDDGYTSKGIEFLAEVLSEYGNVTVVAPNEVQSGMSAALSLGKVLRMEKRSCKLLENGNRVDVYSLTGSPADCVKFAMNKMYRAGGSEIMERDPLDRGYKPDIIFSGINHGSNASVASVYSGTLGAAAEGTLYGVKSVGLSINTHNPQPDFTQIGPFLRTIIVKSIEKDFPEGIYLNVNFPAIESGRIKGFKFASQGKGVWLKEFEQRKDPHGRDYYWMTGEFTNREEGCTGDHNLLEEGYITIVPHRVDSTDYQALSMMENEWGL